MSAIKKYLLPLPLIALVLLVLLSTVAGTPPLQLQSALALLGRPTRLAQELESLFSNNLSIRSGLRDLSLVLRTTAGQQAFDGIWLCDNSLIPMFTPTDDTTLHKRNAREILGFSAREGVPVAVAVLPTASAIYQNRLPPYAADIQFNQHRFIEQLARSFTGGVASVDVYPALFAAQDQYLYYRTDDLLTTHGGFVVYQNLVRRMGMVPHNKNDFSVRFLEQPYYGSLYQLWDYGGVQGDTIALYLHNSAGLFTVQHWQRFQQKTYYSLYPSEAAVSGNPADIILGGLSPKIDITNHSISDSRSRLLVLGDRNMLSVLPFLALHYSSITFADPDLLTDSELAALVPSDYTQVLFAFSIERYMNSAQPTRAATAGTAPLQE